MLILMISIINIKISVCFVVGISLFEGGVIGVVVVMGCLGWEVFLEVVVVLVGVIGFWFLDIIIF